MRAARRRVLLAVLAVVLALPAAASGATVSVEIADSCAGDTVCSKYGGGMPVPVTVLAGAAEHNAVTIARDGSELVLTDTAAPLNAEEPCRAVDATTVRCPFSAGVPAVPGLAVTLGGGDDAARLVGDLGLVAVLTGGAGADVLAGGANADILDGGPGPDRLDGGPGSDVLDYAARSAAVTVDLAAGHGGQAGESDVLAGFEVVTGGTGADRLQGGPAGEQLDGGPGPDVLRGGGGPDRLNGDRGADLLQGQAGPDSLEGDPEQGDGFYTAIVKMRDDRLEGGAGDDYVSDLGGRNIFLGGPGADVLDGGPREDVMRAGSGDDRVRARDGRADRIDCGPGRDRARIDGNLDVRRRCEQRRG